ncbi:tetratricopeptide repeat protein [Dolichospermum sp. ST_sed3]|nr:tetratricopeptide repeat protein [Dolichospermum sp. ST_sed3]
MTYTANWFTYYSKGEALLEVGMVDDAITALRKSIQLDPEFPLAYDYLGDAYIKKNELQNAIECFRNAMKFNGYADGQLMYFAFHVRGIECEASGEYDKAIVYYTMAIEEEPGRLGNYISRGIVYAQMDQFNEALADFNATVRLAPNDYLAYYNRGLCHIEMGLYREAMDDISNSLQLKPYHQEAFLEYVELIAISR